MLERPASTIASSRPKPRTMKVPRSMPLWSAFSASGRRPLPIRELSLSSATSLPLKGRAVPLKELPQFLRGNPQKKSLSWSSRNSWKRRITTAEKILPLPQIWMPSSRYRPASSPSMTICARSSSTRVFLPKRLPSFMMPTPTSAKANCSAICSPAESASLSVLLPRWAQV